MSSEFDIVTPAFEFGRNLPFVAVQEPAPEAFASFLRKGLTT